MIFRIGFAIALVFASVLGVSGQIVEEIQYETSDSVTIHGSYYPAGKFPKATLLLLHMLRKSRESWRDFAVFAQKNELAILAIDLRGHGQSKTRGEVEIRETIMNDSDHAKMINDVTGAVQWIRSRTAPYSENLIIIGASIGANLAVKYAVDDPRIKGVVLLSPGEEYRGFQLIPMIEKYGERPLLAVAAEDDSYSAIACRRISDLPNQKMSVHMFREGGHGTYLLENNSEIAGLIMQFAISVSR